MSSVERYGMILNPWLIVIVNAECLLIKSTFLVSHPEPAAMSIEYTIDIQLQELGFPGFGQTQEPSVREPTGCHSTPSENKVPATHCSTSLSTAHNQALRVLVQQAIDRKGSDGANTQAAQCKPIDFARSSTEVYEKDDSDNSDVSDACEEEEVEEDDDFGDEECLNSGR